MAFCNNCGNQLEENAKFCPVCGTKTEQLADSAAVESTVESTPAKASGVLNTKMLIWAIINLICCCQPLGIASLIITILAKDAPSAEDEAKKIKAAKTCNLIGTIGGAIFNFIYVVFVVVTTLMGAA